MRNDLYDWGISERVLELSSKVRESLAERFSEIDEIAEANTLCVMRAFGDKWVSDACFGGTTGYGYDDLGRETLDKVYASVFGAESALVRLGFVNGTHAISCALFAALEPGQTLLSVTGEPYDTLRSVIGAGGGVHGSLTSCGIGYAEVPLAASGGADIGAIEGAVGDERVGCVFIQRSRGYSKRRTLTVSEIEDIINAVKSKRPDINVVVDNCYGEFTETIEPTHVGADIIAGSLIKNPGGGLAPAGGYVAGRADLIERAAARLTCPGIGGECGATLGQGRLLFQGFFNAPHAVGQAMKTAVFCAGLLSGLGYNVSPGPYDKRSDIIQMAELGSADGLVSFCRGIQAASPVDSHVLPEPWRMPGYDCEVVMAAGTFVQGASIELSADGPVKPPYLAFIQGGLTFESGMLSIMKAASAVTAN